MKLHFYVFLLLLLFSNIGYSQTNSKKLNFHGAVANLKSYKALYILNQSDEKKIKGLIRNINNALNDPRLKGKLQVELVAFGDGVEIFRKTNHYDTLLIDLLPNVRIQLEKEKLVKKNYGHLFLMYPVATAKS
jgi:intracellular sulfur oxidation DsrE/DsrF family protein